MSPLPTCGICGQYLAESTEGRKAHMKRYHNVVAHPVKHTEAQLLAIAARVEARLGADNFVGPGEPPRNKKRCTECGPTDNEGYWLTDGTGICEPCVKKRAGTEEAETWAG